MDIGDFLSFKQMVSFKIIKIIYVLGLIGVTLAGVITIFDSFLQGIAIIVLGNLLWRLFCESAILLFSIHEVLVSIEKK